MRITKYGHACLLVEEGEARILIDPGEFSKGFELLERLDAIFITHQHQDHLKIEHIVALQLRNTEVVVYADEASVAMLKDAGIAAQVARVGDKFEVTGVEIEVFGAEHSRIHADVPAISNVGYMIAQAFFYPGDAFTLPNKPVDILAAPAGAPWLKIGEAVDYVWAVKPRVAIPVHDGVLSDAGRQIHFGTLARLTAELGVGWRVIENGESVEI